MYVFYSKNNDQIIVSESVFWGDNVKNRCLRDFS
jgi:hypothetical protein